MTRLLLVRHAQSEWNAAGRWQGWADPPLTELGETQAREAGQQLVARGARLTAVAASDLHRARRTAEIIAEELGLSDGVHVDDGLRERDVGEWSGCTTAEIDERWPGMRDAWREGRIDHPPGGEADNATAQRLVAALARLAGAHPDGRLLVVTHGGCIRILVNHLGGEATGVPNLGGRWFAWTPDGLVTGEAVTLLAKDHRTVPSGL